MNTAETIKAFTEKLFSADFMPHGHCYFWQADVVWTHVISDSLIAIAYFSIPLMLFRFVRQKREIPFHWVFQLFAAFIFWCGVTHVFDVVTLWYPIYRIDGLARAITALVSVATAILMVRIIPKALALRSPKELETAYRKLEEENYARRLAQSRLEQQSLQLQEQASLLELASDAILVRDQEDRITYWNRGAECLYGWNRTEALGKKTTDFLSTQFPIPLDKIKSELTMNGRWDGELIQTTKSGSHIHVVSRWAMRPASPESPPVVFESNTDITDQKHAQNMVETEKRAQFFKTIAEAIPQLIWIAHADGSHEYFNQRWFEYTGQPVQNDWTEAVAPEDLAMIQSSWKAALVSGRPFEAECRLKSQSYEEYRWHLCRAVPVRDSNAKIEKWFGTCTDIAFQKQTEYDLTQKTEELRRSNRDLEQFAYVSSHDLKEPLRMVTLYVQMLQQQYQKNLDGQAQKYIQFAVEGSRRMGDLINDLLQYSRVDQDKVPSDEIDLNAVLDEVLVSLAAPIKESATEITVSKLPILKANHSQMIQLFQNLISNAIKFRSPGINPRIMVSANLQDGKWLFSVADNGIGVKPEYAERIFVIFQRLHGREKFPGTGIGLAICKKIVERHNGKIWLESDEGRGANFKFTFPLVKKTA